MHYLRTADDRDAQCGRAGVRRQPIVTRMRTPRARRYYPVFGTSALVNVYSLWVHVKRSAGENLLPVFSILSTAASGCSLFDLIRFPAVLTRLSIFLLPHSNRNQKPQTNGSGYFFSILCILRFSLFLDVPDLFCYISVLPCLCMIMHIWMLCAAHKIMRK